jgi:hypothetical protein
MRVALCVFALECLALTLSAYAKAQARPTSVRRFPSEATIENWLLSDDPRLVAWGAHEILASGNQSLTTDLLSLAVAWEPLSRKDADGNETELSTVQLNKRYAMAAVLDALIQMDVPVPAETLRTLAPDFPNAVAILLSRTNQEDAAPLALDFYHSPPPSGYGLQLVSAAMLAQHPPPGFAADLLAGIEVGANVFIVLPDSPPFGFGSAGCFSCLMHQTLPRGTWPPLGNYSLFTESGERSLLLVSGTDSIYAARKESDTYREPCGEPSLGPDQRRRLIAQMLDVSADAIPWETRLSTTIVFQSDQQFRQDLLQFIGEVERKFQTTAVALEDRGFMTSAEVEKSAPKLEIYSNDMRGAEANPIPTITPLPKNVEWPDEPA